MSDATNRSRIEKAQYAYDIGAITYDEFEQILKDSGVPIPKESPNENIQLEKIMHAHKIGAITDKEYENLLSEYDKRPMISTGQGKKGYQRGESSLDIKPEEIEKYDKRREQSIKQLEGLPHPIASAIEYLYPKGEEAAQQQQSGAKRIRNIATLPGTLLDAVSMPANFIMGLAGKPTYVPSQMIGQGIDTLTNQYTHPETDPEKMEEALTQSVLPMSAIRGTGQYLASQSPKYINKFGKYLQSANETNPANLFSTIGGTAATQYYANQNPDAGLLSSAGIGILGSLAGGKAGKNIDILHRPSAAMARMFHVNPNKVANQIIDKNTGKYIPSTLADISDSEAIKMGQYAMGKTPFLGNIVENARNRAINAEKTLLNKMGFNKALPSEEAGNLALKGRENYQNILNKKEQDWTNTIESGLQEHAKPYQHPLPNPEYLEKLERKKYKAQIQRKMNKQNPELDSVDYKKKQSDIDKKNKLIDKITGVSENVMKNMPINLVDIPKSQKYMKKWLGGFDTRKSQLEALNSKFGKIVQSIEDYSSEYNGKSIPYKTIDSLIYDIDDAVSTWGQVGNKTQGHMKRFRTKLQNDVGDYLESVNPSLKKVWQERKDFWHNYKNTEEKFMTHIKNLGDKGDISAVTNDLLNNLKNAGRKVTTISKGLNDKQKEQLGFSFMKEMGKAAQDADFDLFTFSKRFRQMKGNGKNAFLDLFSPDQRESIQRLSGKLSNIEEATKLRTQSPTGYINAYYRIIRHPIKSIPGTIGSGIVLGLYTNKTFLNWISKGAKINNETQMHKHIGKLKAMNLGSNSLNQAARSLYNRLENEDSENLEKEE